MNRTKLNWIIIDLNINGLRSVGLPLFILPFSIVKIENSFPRIEWYSPRGCAHRTCRQYHKYINNTEYGTCMLMIPLVWHSHFAHWQWCAVHNTFLGHGHLCRHKSIIDYRIYNYNKLVLALCTVYCVQDSWLNPVL